MTLIYIIPLYVLAWLCASFCLRDSVLQEKSVSSAKYWQIEGLRFYLAFSVFIHHTFIIRNYVASGVWSLTGDRVITFLGQGGVSLFFIITAFLFWDKALRKPYQFDAVEFLIGRVRRLAPAYLVVALPFLLLSLSYFPDLTWGLLRDILQIIAFGFFGAIDVGSLGLSPAYAGVFWTLFYEWRFYFFLPALYILLRYKNHNRTVMALCMVILILSVLSDVSISREWPYISLFACGILAATLYRSKYFEQLKLDQSLVVLIFIGSLLANLYSSETYYGNTKPVLFIITFLSLLKIEPLSIIGKLLNAPPAVLLGGASYSIYVVHGFVISAISILFSLIFGNQFSNAVFILFCTISSLMVTAISLAVYKYIEVPYAFRKPAVVIGEKSA